MRSPLALRVSALGCLIVVLIALSLPLGNALEIGADEGFELAKTELCLRGHRLYSDIWNDQPPLYTFLLTRITKWADGSAKKTYEREERNNIIRPAHSILAQRLLTTASAALMLASVFITVRKVSGRRVALLTLIFLATSPGFVELSCSCMLEVPALALATAALALLSLRESSPGHPRRALVQMFLAGVIFGMALQTKLVPAMLLPLAGFLLLVGAPGRTASRGVLAILKRLIVAFLPFSCALLVSYVGVDALIERGAYLAHFKQSWVSHFGAAQSAEYGSASDHPFDWGVLVRNWDTTMPALVGIIVLLAAFARAKSLGGNWKLLLCQTSVLTPQLPLLWLLLALCVFTTHKPWWSYYYIHLAIPLSWCAGSGLAFLIARAYPGPLQPKNPVRKLMVPRRSVFLRVALALALVSIGTWQAARVYIEITAIRQLPRTDSSLMLAELLRYKPFTKWLYTEDLVYSFHADIPIPPQLAVMPLKRFWSGEMTNARVAEEMEKYRPGLILLRNPAHEVPFQKLLNSEYRRVFQDATHSLYAHSSINEKGN